MDCYNFIQQYENYSVISESRGHNQVSFATIFLKKNILNRWQQHKRKIEAKTLIAFMWAEFNVFLQRGIDETRTSFVLFTSINLKML